MVKDRWILPIRARFEATRRPRRQAMGTENPWDGGDGTELGTEPDEA